MRVWLVGQASVDSKAIIIKKTQQSDLVKNAMCAEFFLLVLRNKVKFKLKILK